MKRRVLVGLLLLSMLLAACSKAPPKRKVEDAPAPVLKVTVPASGQDPVMDALIQGFTAQRPEVKVERVPVDPFNHDALNALKSRGEVDVVTAGVGNTAGLLSLEPYIAKDGLDLNRYGKVTEALRRDGVIRGLPFQMVGMMMAYNKQLVDQAGVKIPVDGWTWDQFREVAAKLVRQDAEGPIPGVIYELPETLVQIYIEGKTGQPAWMADEATMRDALAFFDTMVNTDKSLATVLRKGVMEPGTYYMGRDFMAGKVPLGPLFVRGMKKQTLDFAFELVPLPTHPNGRRVSQGIIGLLGIAQGSANADLAWEFIRYAVGREGAEQLARAGYLPAYSAPDWVAWIKQNRPAESESVYTLYETNWSVSGYITGQESGRHRAFQDVANQVVSGKARAGAALADWKRAVEK